MRQVALANFTVAKRAARLRLEDPGLKVSTVVTQGEPSEELAVWSGPDALIVVGGSYESTEGIWQSSGWGGARRVRQGTGRVIPIDDA